MHGTYKSYAQSIQKSGFQTGQGRHGKGAYFWTEGFRALELSMCFVRDKASRDQKNNRRRYENINDSSEVVLQCDIVIESSGLLDLDDIDVKEMMHEHIRAQRANLANVKGSDMYKASILMDNFIKRYERELKSPIQAVTALTQTPESYRNGFIKAEMWTGMDKAKCLAVRDLDTINMATIEVHQPS